MKRTPRDGDRSRPKSKKGTKVNRREALVEKMQQGRVKLGLGEFGMDESDRRRYLEEEAAERAAAEKAEAAARAEDEDSSEDAEEEEEEEPRKRGKKGKKFIDVCHTHAHARRRCVSATISPLLLLLLFSPLPTEKRHTEPD